MTEVKICGLTEPAGLDAALSGGARYVGFVFFPKSPRNLSAADAASLAARARGRAAIVAVTVDPDDAMLESLAGAVRPDFIQLHGRESPARARDVRRFARQGVIKAIPIARSPDLDSVSAYADAADMFLFDAAPPPGAALPGGNGAAFDWRILRGRAFPRPALLSGGLNPDNVGLAIAESGLRGVDVSSGVERAPGLKDADLVTRFIDNARAAST